jgi:5'-deoxynucleotidase YfbR-like HD superfamily hydrolase
MEILDFIVFGSETKRFHTMPTLREQRVDSHSHGVAMLCMLLAESEPSANLLLAALTHDLAEHKFGDLPAPAKRTMPDTVDVLGRRTFRQAWGDMETTALNEVGLRWDQMLSDKERRWLKLADAMEGCLYCIRERMMGNKYINVCYDNFRSYIQEQLVTDEEEAVADIVGYIQDMWEQANG